mmetsp:Transcript_116485/g.336467  ORF Transcript_116485/g.336467 Transcript_116485/m.336467 type:complete len:261 (+) Transcript_116485:716-1498(+)
MRRDVHVNRVLVFTKGIDDHGSELQDFTSHITRTSRESTPVGKDHDRKAFLGKVTDGLGGLVRRIREQDLTSLRKDGFSGVGISRVGRDNLFHLTSFNGDGTHGDTTKTTTSNDNSLTPSGKVFLEASGIKETRKSSISGHHQTRVIGGRSRAPFDLAVNGISAIANSRQSTDVLRDETQPLDHGSNTSLVVVDNFVRNTVGEHDLRSTKLVLRVVHLSSKKLVQGRVSGQNNRSLLHLDHALSKTDQVGSNTNTSSSYI